jgi:hypothetical protein
MNKKKILPFCLALMLILGSNMMLWSFAAPAGKIFVDPATNEFSSDPIQPNYRAVGDNFTVNVNVADFVDPGIYAYEFKLFYDNTLLSATAWALPEGHFLTPAEGEMPIYLVPASGIYQEDGYVLVAITLQGDAAGKTGAGTLATVTFEITQAPPPAGVLSCDLELRELVFADPDINDVEVTAENGYYEYSAPRPPLPYLKVLPETSSAEEVGDEIVVDITIQDLAADWQAVGFQWKLIYDTAILEVLGNVSEGDFLKQFGDTYFYAIVEADYIISFTLYLDPFEPGFTGVFPEGSGILATITFNAIYSPGSCDLELTEVLIIDAETNPIETRPHESGKYVIPLPPWLSIEPDTYTAKALNEEFDLKVFINELKGDLKMVGAEFKIRYNLTMLELTTITEAGFMKHFADLAGTDTWFQYYVEEDPTSGYGIVGVMILPIENGTWPGPFPDTVDYGAPGDLAIVTFNPIYQHDELELTSDIYLDEIILANPEATEIPYDTTRTEIEGICKYTILRAIPPFEGFLDLMTQYPYPWSGQGRDAASDAFPPQGVVQLLGNVTYRGDVVPGKPVSYAIMAPNSETYYATAFTDEDGIAVFAYSLPSSEGHFGLWTVEASVDLAGTVVSDTLYFLMGWLVEVAEIGAPETAYKGETMGTNVTLTRICMQDPRNIMDKLLLDPSGSPITNNDLLFYITVTDELKQPVATQLLNTSMITESGFSQGDLKEFIQTIGGQWMDRITIIRAQYPELASLVMNGIGISPAAYSGFATIHVNLLTDFPGVAYCPEGLETVWIQKRK